MSHYLRNLTDSPVYNVELTDLGITVEVGTDYDTSELDSGDLGNSVDLETAITVGEVAFLDDAASPLVPLSPTESQAIISASSNAATNILGTENFFPKWADDCPCTLTESNMYQDPITGYIGINLTENPVGSPQLTPATDLEIKGALQLTGSTSGYTRFTVSATGDNVVYILPNNDGDSNQVLQTSGSGTLTWVNQTVGVSGIGDLTNVTISSVASSEVLIYQGSPAEWQNNTLAEAGIASSSHTHAINDLTDVAIGSPTPQVNNVLTYDGSNWKAGVGNVYKQIVYGSIAKIATTAIIPNDDTLPTSSEGTQIWSANITPSTTTAVIKINFSITVDMYTGDPGFDIGFNALVSVFRDSINIGGMSTETTAYNEEQMAIVLVDEPATTSQVTYSARVGIPEAGSGTLYVNRLETEKYGGMLNQQGYTLEEIDQG